VIVDSSAIVAILLKEPGHDALQEQIASADVARVGAPTLVETSIVLTARLGLVGKTLLARFVQEAELQVVDFTDDHWTIAGDAYVRFGKGRHPVGLNYGDCLTYAVAKAAGEPLLCKGDDYPATDLTLANEGPATRPDATPHAGDKASHGGEPGDP
jgi:ribonuclease VapC